MGKRCRGQPAENKYQISICLISRRKRKDEEDFGEEGEEDLRPEKGTDENVKREEGRRVSNKKRLAKLMERAVLKVCLPEISACSYRRVQCMYNTTLFGKGYKV